MSTQRHLSRRTSGRITSALTLAALLSTSAAAMAQDQQMQMDMPMQQGQQAAPQPQSQPSAAEMAQMRKDVQTAASWRLPPDFMPRMTTTLQALRASGLQPPPPGEHLSLDATIQRVNAVQGLAPLLKAHGFTARDFVLGLTCFGMTVALTRQPQGQNSAQAPKLNPANIALINSSPENVQALMQEMSTQPQ
ncbi:hypothetical protein [Acetobacter fallax]|uniref:Uncharacterized protein n=1 Tax=Acetobacter fallax TaxID=1737473 RepID=A0ABX0KBG2_9PROT|nr:hypothetical protein [Acetobacter fallax]NHO33128.1 hypothetical protein [Acetobacter fallax]NHO36724.1 hypothetical protein [Acetobacter fallax]